MNSRGGIFKAVNDAGLHATAIRIPGQREQLFFLRDGEDILNDGYSMDGQEVIAYLEKLKKVGNHDNK